MQNTKGDETMTDVTTIGSLLLQKLMNALHQSLKVDSLHYIGTPRYRDTHEWFCDGVKFYTSWKATGIPRVEQGNGIERICHGYSRRSNEQKRNEGVSV